MAVKVGQVLIDISADTTRLVKGMNNAEKRVKSAVRNMKRALASLAIGGAFASLIKDGLKYNSALETTQQSIAGLLVATSKLVDEQGKAITSQELYNTAMGESADILKDLQRINSETPISLNETAQVYKTILPSMRAVGATQEELIELTKNLAVASGVAGIKANQLLAGVDGLASGTVLANSELGRFLTSLGLTNDKLKNSKDVVELLNSRLKLLKGEITMDMQLSNLSETWQSTLGIMTRTLWESSKEWIDTLIHHLKRTQDLIKMIPEFFRAAMATVVQEWNVGIAKIILVWEEFLDVLKIGIDYFSGLGQISVGYNVDLEQAKEDLKYAEQLSKSFAENLGSGKYASENSVSSGARTVASSMTKVAEETKKATVATDKLKDSVKEVKTDYQKLEEDSITGLGDAMTNMFVDWQEGALDWRDTMRNVLNDILAQMFQMLVVKQLISGIGGGGFNSVLGQFAQGGAFDNGVQRFATGGVVSSPTIFPMANGMGLMGEAGPEAVMPLTRIGGDLGVKVDSSPAVVNVNNYGNDNVSVSQDGNNIDIVISQIAQGIQRGTNSIGDAIESRYGVRKV